MSLGYVILVLTVYALAAARVTRLINADTVTDPIRIAVARRARDEGRSETERERWSTLEYFIGCPWCVSMWLAFATVWAPLFFAENRVVQYVAVALAVSHLVGVCARFASDEDIQITEG